MEPDAIHPRLLAEFIPKDAFVGAGLILRHRGLFLFGVRPLRWDGDRPMAEITGIGGRIEAQDNSLSAGVQREACEEIGHPVRIIPCECTLLVRGHNEQEWASISGAEQPVAIVYRYYKAPPHQPWNAPAFGQPNYRPPSCIVIFLAELENEPQLTEELPALVWLTPEQILQTARQDICIGELLAAGMPIMRLRQDYPVREHWARLTDSQEALALSLDEGTLEFYNRLLRL